MKLRQLQVSADNYEDRLVLRAVLGDSDEYRAYITRRLLHDMWPLLMHGLDDPSQDTPRMDDAAVHEAQLAAASGHDFAQAFDNPEPTFPLGSRPILVGELSLQATQEKQYKLVLREPKARAFTLNFDKSVLHTLCTMFKAAADVMQWGLSLEFAPGTPVLEQDFAPDLVPPPRSLLH